MSCHEIAHDKYGTVAEQKRFAEQYVEEDQPLASLCFNAVADEFRFERAEVYFARLGEESVRMAQRAVSLPSPPPKEVPPRVLVAAGIRLARSKPRSLVRRLLCGEPE